MDAGETHGILRAGLHLLQLQHRLGAGVGGRQYPEMS